MSRAPQNTERSLAFGISAPITILEGKAIKQYWGMLYGRARWLCRLNGMPQAEAENVLNGYCVPLFMRCLRRHKPSKGRLTTLFYYSIGHGRARFLVWKGRNYDPSGASPESIPVRGGKNDWWHPEYLDPQEEPITGKQLRKAVMALPDKPRLRIRTAINLRYSHGKLLREIGAHLGLTRERARHLVDMGLKMLRRGLEEKKPRG